MSKEMISLKNQTPISCLYLNKFDLTNKDYLLNLQCLLNNLNGSIRITPKLSLLKFEKKNQIMFIINSFFYTSSYNKKNNSFFFNLIEYYNNEIK